MDNQPLISIICLCHNQKAFVGEAIRSVLSQTYSNIELIVVDDGSTDGSQQEIETLISGTEIPFISLETNIGNCAAFNHGYRLSKGDYLIDLAADDILLPKRVEEGVLDFQKSSPKAGVHFSDAFMIKTSGEPIGTHYARNQEGTLTTQVPYGDLYGELIARYFICPPTMMIKREVFETLNGYDETLKYEDFDFWVRSSRVYEYIFNKAPLVKKRVVPKSHGVKQFALRSKYMFSTYEVCQKIFHLNQTQQEDALLIKRINYEIRQCIKTLNFSLVIPYLKLRKDTQRRLSSSSSMDK